MERTLEAAFGKVLKTTREERGMSQEDLSFEAGLHRTYVSLLERGRNAPSIRALWALAQALDVRPSELIRGVERHFQA